MRDPKRRWAVVKEVSAREAENRVAEDAQHAFRNTMPGSNYGAHDKSRLASIFFQDARLASFGPAPSEMPSRWQLPSEIVFFVRTSTA